MGPGGPVFRHRRPRGCAMVCCTRVRFDLSCVADLVIQCSNTSPTWGGVTGCVAYASFAVGTCRAVWRRARGLRDSVA